MKDSLGNQDSIYNLQQILQRFSNTADVESASYWASQAFGHLIDELAARDTGDKQRPPCKGWNTSRCVKRSRVMPSSIQMHSSTDIAPNHAGVQSHLYHQAPRR